MTEKSIEIVGEQRPEVVQLGAETRGHVYPSVGAHNQSRDIDETRRLLYGSLAAGRTRRWELVGTLVNALVHHSGLVEDPYDLLDYFVEVVENPMAGAGGYERGQRVRDLIQRLSS